MNSQNNENNDIKLEKDVEFIDYIIGQLRKIDSRIFAGQIILAFRETRKLLAFLENQKKSISQNKENKTIPNPTKEI